jgi:hypothetical protein
MLYDCRFSESFGIAACVFQAATLACAYDDAFQSFLLFC